MKYLFTVIAMMVVSVTYAQSDSTYSNNYSKASRTRKVDLSFDVGGIFGLNRGYLIATDAGISMTGSTHKKYISTGYNNNMAEIAIVIAKPINERLRIGGGVSFDLGRKDVYDPTIKNTSLLLPAYLNIKYNFIKRRVSPFLSSQIGAAYYVGYYSGYGATGALNLGVKGYVSKRVALNFLLGFRMQHIVGGQYQYTDGQGNPTIQVNPNNFLYFLTARFGITF